MPLQGWSVGLWGSVDFRFICGIIPSANSLSSVPCKTKEATSISPALAGGIGGEPHNSSQGQTALTDVMGPCSVLGHEMAMSSHIAELWLLRNFGLVGALTGRKVSERTFQKGTSTEMN